MHSLKKDFNYITNGEIDLEVVAILDKNKSAAKNETYFFDIYQHNSNDIIGRVDFRVGNFEDEEINNIGNIGIDINALYQRRGYALMTFKMLEELALQSEIDELTITCEPTNETIKKIADILNYEYVDYKKIPHGTAAYLNGFRERLLYRKNLKMNVRKK